MEYPTDNNILYKYQSSFRKRHSTDTSFSYLRDNILAGVDSGLLTTMILIDLQKAFDSSDTIYHILLRTMISLRFSNHSVIWFESYLSDRSFGVNIKHKYSSIAQIFYSSKLNVEYLKDMSYDLRWFCLYVNDMK